MPIKLSVNCWFCNATNYVSFFKRNSWYCTSCEQYNGFTKNGDYNKEIPEMYQTQPPSSTTSTNRYKTKQQIHKSTNCLCDKCNLNQEIKLFRLREYQNQLNKANNSNNNNNMDDLNDDLSCSDFNINDVEVNLYKEYLDKIYDLCESCKSKVKFEIRKQDGILKEYLYKLGNFKYFFERKTINQIKKVKLPSMDMSKILANFLVLLVSVAVMSLYALNSYKIIDFSYGFMALLSAYVTNVLLFTSNYEPIDLIILFIQYISMYLHYTNHFFVHFEYEFQLVLAQIVVCTSVMVKVLLYKRRKNVNVIKQTNGNVHRPSSSTIFDQNYFSRSFSTATNPSKKSTKSSFSLIQPPKFNYQNDGDNKFASFSNNNRLAYALSLPDKSMFKREDESLNGNAGGDDTDDDDSSSIISGMTNLYLEKSNHRMRSCNSFDSNLSMSTLTSQQQHKANQFYITSYYLLSALTVITNASIVTFFAYRWFFGVKNGA